MRTFPVTRSTRVWDFMLAFARGIVEAVRHPLLVLDSEMRVVAANSAFYRTYELDSSNTIGHDLFELGAGRWNHPDFRRLLGGVIPRNATFKDHEIVCDVPGLGQRLMIFDAHRVLRDDGKPMVLLAMEDDTERREIHSELGLLNAELERRVVEMGVTDRELARFVEATRQQTQLHSDAQIEALEQKARDLADFVESLRNQTQLKSDTEIASLVQKALDLAVFVETARTETQLRSEFEISALELQARDLAVSVENVREKTLRQSRFQIAALGKSEQATSRLNEELERRVTERTMQLETTNRELEAFSFSVSHDLRSPLRAMDGFSQELLTSYADQLDDQGQHYLRRIRSGTQRMGQLIDELLKLSRMSRDEMRREQIDLSALAETVSAEIREREPERNVRFTAQQGLTAECDPHLIRVVLENLLGNAWKFTAKKTEATITFQRIEVEGRSAFVVRDDGAGFNMAYSKKLFGAFQRLHSDREFPGTGIGLATVQRVIRRHGGEIWADGAVDRGAAFCFTLPASGEAP